MTCTIKTRSRNALAVCAALSLTTALPLPADLPMPSMVQQAHAFGHKKAARAIRKDFKKARRKVGRDLNKARKQIAKDLGSDGGKLIVGIGAGLLVGIATDSAAAGILTGVILSGTPEVFQKQLYDAHGRDMEWSSSFNSNKQRIIVPPGRKVSSAQRRAVNAVAKKNAKEVQTALKELGLYKLAIDGDFGPGSRAGVKEFQRTLGAPETGALTAEQRYRLFLQAEQSGYVRQASLSNDFGEPVFIRRPAVIAPKDTVDADSQPAVSVPTIAEYRLAKLRFDKLTSDYLQTGAISAVTAAQMQPDGTVVIDVLDASGAKQTLTGKVSAIYAEPHALAAEWARIYFRGADGESSTVLNTRDDFASSDLADEWMAQVNGAVTLLAKLTGETVPEPETRIATVEPPKEEEAPVAAVQPPDDATSPEGENTEIAQAEMPEKAADVPEQVATADPDTLEAGQDGKIDLTGVADAQPTLEVAAIEPIDQPADADGKIKIREVAATPITPAPNTPAKTPIVEEVTPVALVTPSVVPTITGFDAEPEKCRQEIYFSYSFPEGHENVPIFNLTPPPETFEMSNGDGSAYINGRCILGEYSYSYVAVQKGDKPEEWSEQKHEGSFMLASNAEQCNVNLNTPDGSAQLDCF
ncbi:MAG: peptidoglycan-binding protein [Pseudomonadota bacterium]